MIRGLRSPNVVHESPVSHRLRYEGSVTANYQRLRPDLHRFLGSLVNDLHGTPLEIGGVADHVHVLARIKPVISISEFLSKFKSQSSGWANRKTHGRFKWQVKYGAFTVSQSQVDRVREYIRNQEVHHSRISFEEEFKALLQSHGIEFEEKYLWI